MTNSTEVTEFCERHAACVYHDKVRLILDGVTVINDWYDRGGGCGQTADVDFSDGEPKQLIAWWYENGGGTHATLLHYTGSGWSAVPSE